MADSIANLKAKRKNLKMKGKHLTTEKMLLKK